MRKVKAEEYKENAVGYAANQARQSAKEYSPTPSDCASAEGGKKRYQAKKKDQQGREEGGGFGGRRGKKDSHAVGMPPRQKQKNRHSDTDSNESTTAHAAF